MFAHRPVSRFRDPLNRSRGPGGVLLPALLFLICSSPASAQVAAPAAGAALRPDTPAPVWLDREGKPLPFTNTDELLDFLRTARVVRYREIRGITRPYEVQLEKNGIRMRGAFNYATEEKAIVTLQRTGTQIGFRDTYLFNLAAYELSRLLGLDNVPPAVERKVAGKRGALSAWIENAMEEATRRARKMEPPDVEHYNRQVYVMHVFDALIENTDRTLENVLIGPDWKVWMIDHTRAFRRSPEPKNLEALEHCERGLWEKLRTLDEAVVRERLKKILRRDELEALLQRRQKLVEHFQKLIDERGEENVLYTLP